MDSDSSHRADFTGILGLSVRPLEAENRFSLRLTIGLGSPEQQSHLRNGSAVPLF